MIRYIKGDATKPKGTGNKLIIHVCNDIGKWGRGFVLSISKRWTSPEVHYKVWYNTDKEPYFKLGEVQFVKVEKDIYVANMIAQHDIYTKNNIPPIRYNELSKCLIKVNEFSIENNTSIHMPKIGCGLAGGSWNKVLEIIKKYIDNKIEVFIYELGE